MYTSHGMFVFKSPFPLPYNLFMRQLSLAYAEQNKHCFWRSYICLCLFAQKHDRDC